MLRQGQTEPAFNYVTAACPSVHARLTSIWQGLAGMLDRNARIVIAGAGSIGCYLGGCLALAGRRVTLLLRPNLANDIALHGLRISDFARLNAALPASAFELSSDPEFALAAAQVLLVTVKSGATAEMARLIAQYAPADAIVASLQNGVGNVDALVAHLGAARTHSNAPLRFKNRSVTNPRFLATSTPNPSTTGGCPRKASLGDNLWCPQ